VDATHDMSPGSLPDITRKLTSGAGSYSSESDGVSESALNAVSASSDAPLDTEWKALARELDSYGCVVVPDVLRLEQGCKESCRE
jgi:hypothetical protein